MPAGPLWQRCPTSCGTGSLRSGSGDMLPRFAERDGALRHRLEAVERLATTPRIEDADEGEDCRDTHDPEHGRQPGLVDPKDAPRHIVTAVPCRGLVEGRKGAEGAGGDEGEPEFEAELVLEHPLTDGDDAGAGRKSDRYHDHEQAQPGCLR